jgi:hypothetical protein
MRLHLDWTLLRTVLQSRDHVLVEDSGTHLTPGCLLLLAQSVDAIASAESLRVCTSVAVDLHRRVRHLIDKTRRMISYIAPVDALYCPHAGHAERRCKAKVTTSLKRQPCIISTYRHGIINSVCCAKTRESVHPPINIIGLFCMVARSPMSACFSALRLTACPITPSSWRSRGPQPRIVESLRRP